MWSWLHSNNFVTLSFVHVALNPITTKLLSSQNNVELFSVRITLINCLEYFIYPPLHLVSNSTIYRRCLVENMRIIYIHPKILQCSVTTNGRTFSLV